MAADKSVVLVTGANTGLGWAAVVALWESSPSYHIILAGRTESKVKDAVAELSALPSAGNSTVEPLIVDVASDESIAAAYAAVSAAHPRIDALVNNAGGTFDNEITAGRMTTRESYNATYNLNVSSQEVMTQTFVPLLIKSPSPRLLFITSGLASLHEEQSKTWRMPRPPVPAGWPKPPNSNAAAGYRASKAALNMLALQWARLTAEDGVKTFIISPGFLATNLGGNQELLKKMGGGDPALGGGFLKDVIEGKQDEFATLSIRRDGVQAW